MPKFSANLGFLWTEYELVEAIGKAKAAGFEAVECHWPYEVPAADLKVALDKAELPMLGLNTLRGNVAAGEAGLTAVPGREDEARANIDQAVAYGAELDCSVIHVMSGVAEGEDARRVFVDNLKYAATQAANHAIDIVIEPINTRDIPGYFLNEVEQAADIIKDVGKQNLKIMFDCYHVQIMQGDLLTRLKHHLPQVGHIQIAAVPDRGEPDAGELNFKEICSAIDAMGYTGYIGAEYKPRKTTDEGLAWMTTLA